MALHIHHLKNTIVVVSMMLFGISMQCANLQSSASFTQALNAAINVPTADQEESYLKFFEEAYKDLRQTTRDVASIFDSQGRNLLMAAAQVGNEPIVTYLINHKFDVNARAGTQANTALMYAVSSPVDASTKVSIVEKLVKRGADVNAVNSGGISVLMLASKAGNSDIVSFLLPKVQNPNVQDQSKYTALMLAPTSTIVSLFLADSRVDATLQDKNGLTVLMRKVLQNDAASVQVLLANNSVLSSLDEQDVQGNSIIFYALYNCTVPATDQSTGKAVSTITCCATNPGSVDLVKFLVSKNVSLNLKNSQGNTPLIEAIKACYQSTYVNGKCICTAYAKPDAIMAIMNATNLNLLMPDNNGKTAFEYILDLAVQTQDFSLFNKMLPKAPDDVKKLIMFKAAGKGLYNVVKQLVKGGLSANAADSNGKTLLMYAASANPESVDLVGYLIGLRANTTAVDKNGTSPLMYAALAQNNGAAKKIIENLHPPLKPPYNTLAHNPKAKPAIDAINQATKSGLTALMFAAATQNVELGKNLLLNGADPTMVALVESIDTLKNKGPAVDKGQVSITASSLIADKTIKDMFTKKNMVDFGLLDGLEDLYTRQETYDDYWHVYNKVINDMFLPTVPKWW